MNPWWQGAAMDAETLALRVPVWLSGRGDTRKNRLTSHDFYRTL